MVYKREKKLLLAIAISILALILSAAACTADQLLSSETEPGMTDTTEYSSTTDSTATETQTGTEPSDTTTTEGSATTKKVVTTTTKKKYSKPDTGEELRGVWVAYMELDAIFKGKTMAQVEQVKSEIDTIMIKAKGYGLNAVFFHVRSHSNAYYISDIFEPAAKAKALIEGGFDPLEYAVDAAHSRGLEIHAWVNPYRIGASSNFPKSAHFKGFKENEDYFKSDGNYFYNPASDKAINLIVSGIEEIVQNYDVDGVHFDDYFYRAVPGSSPAAYEQALYNKYKSGGGKLHIGGWRRERVSELIKKAYTASHKRSGCVFGVSPSANVAKNRDEYYADVEKWMRNKGYLDYICPQVYFGFKHKTWAFDKTVDSWAEMERHDSVRLFIGLALHKIGMKTDRYARSDEGKSEWKTYDDIMKRSLLYARSKPECGGVIFFRYEFFMASQMKESSSWVKEIAVREVENLLSVLRP